MAGDASTAIAVSGNPALPFWQTWDAASCAVISNGGNEFRSVGASESVAEISKRDSSRS
jgi:hypothetical protein